MKKKFGAAISVFIILAVLILAQGCMVVTYPDEYTIIKQFGRIESIRETPGLSLKLPFIQTAESIQNEVLLYDLAVSDVMTKDKKSMIADCFVLWEIEDPYKYTQTLSAQKSNAEFRIDTIVYNSLKNVISSLSQEEVISGRDGELTKAIMENIGDTLGQYGIRLLAVETKSLDLPDENKNAVYERMISERNNIAATYQAEGQEEAKEISNNTTAEIIVMQSQANAQAEEIIAKGEAEYMRILSEAYNDPEKADFYLFLRALDAAKATMTGDNKTLIIDETSPIAQIFYSRGQ
ncbi:MAG: protease modulator HflC [Lachnospiraceae bacterium]|uniref:protease modulator HflC n=2 Tax=Parablautia intestinalis TaxID=2320100 RepID=UPI0023C83D54|nr:protease modulator HflC [Parablautia intestinalis]MCI8614594.1 protease modulator HflC [Lachnospiraceae bacterium]MDE7047638.1 protease modulator HflC [Lachnospiraceae bacterium]